jgi:cytochrome c553
MKVIALLLTLTVLIITSTAQAQDAGRGGQLFSSCVECHGQNAGGIEGKGPVLAGQYDWYIVTSLKDYKKGARKHPKAQGLSEQDMKDLAAHISRLK